MHFENGFLHRIESKLIKLNVLGFIKYTLALTLAVGLIFSIISVVLHYTVTESNLMERDPKSSFIELFAISVVLAPIVETFIFQHIPYFLYKKGVIFCSKPKWLLIFSALIFGAIHFYSSLYMVATFFSGLVYMVGYISRANISTKHTYWIIVAVHALNNLLIIGLHSLADLIPSS